MGVEELFLQHYVAVSPLCSSKASQNEKSFPLQGAHVGPFHTALNWELTESCSSALAT